MNCERAKELIADSLAGSLEEAARADLDAHLEECAACRDEQRQLGDLWTGLERLPDVELGPEADDRFRAMLEAYRAGLAGTEKESGLRPALADRIRGLWPGWPAWQFAIVLVLFASGVLLGWGLRPRGQETSAAEVATLHQEVLNLKEQMALALLEQKSVSERLRGVEWTTRLEQPGDEILGALLRALEADPNVNVRLAAVEALEPYARQAAVRRALLSSLPRQPSPLVQVELIHLLVEMDEKESVPVLRSLTEREDTDATVRERARWGLAQLG